MARLCSKCKTQKYLTQLLYLRSIGFWVTIYIATTNGVSGVLFSNDYRQDLHYRYGKVIIGPVINERV